MLMSWHGDPPLMIVTGSILSPLMYPMSPRCFISGKFFFVTRIGSGSISLAQTGFIPQMLAASSNPPLPEKRDPIVTSVIFPIPFSSRTSGSAYDGS